MDKLNEARNNFQKVLDQNIEKTAKQEQKIRENTALPSVKKSTKKIGKKRKKEMDQKNPNKIVYPYAVSLFDRYVDVSKFNHNTKLRMMCREWIRNDLTRQVTEVKPASSEDTFSSSTSKSNLNGPLSAADFENLETKLKSVIPEKEISYVPSVPDINQWKNRWRMVRKVHVEKSLIKMDSQKDDLKYISDMIKQYE